MRLGLMVEGQENVTWEQWVALAAVCERHGIEALFRSDHYASVREGHVTASLDAWTTLAGLAVHTTHLRLGTLVSPVTFRHPSLTAKSVVTVDHISGGRVELGLGAGWLQSEHRMYGFAFPETAARMQALGEQAEIIHRQWTEEHVDFDGRHYRMQDLRALPKPVQRPHPPLILGGGAGPQSARLAARWADEYNTFDASPEACRRRREQVAEACQEIGRDPASLRFSLMMPCITAGDRAELLERIQRLQEIQRRPGNPEEFLKARPDEYLVGTVDEVMERLYRYQQAGVERVLLGHLIHDDLEMVRLVGEELAPALR
jgi:F420-dependent oxidoreductase-like protein